jgi:hypothetical protein
MAGQLAGTEAGDDDGSLQGRDGSYAIEGIAAWSQRNLIPNILTTSSDTIVEYAVLVKLPDSVSSSSERPPRRR